MADNNNNSSSIGKVSYGHNIAASIIALAAKEINGVAALRGRGVRTEFINNTINVDVHMDIFSGFSCCDVAFLVQENVKRSIETSTQYKVGVININVLGVVAKGEEAEVIP